MRNAVLQLAVLVGLMAAAGTIHNVANSGNSQKHLHWVNSSLYINPYTPQPPVADPAVAPDAPVKPEDPPLGTTQPVKGALEAPVGEGSKPLDATSNDPPPIPLVPPTTPGAQTMISLAEAYQNLVDGALFIDARRTRDYESGHIPTAISLSPWEADYTDKISKLIEGGAILEAPLVVYCGNSKECEDSKLVCAQLKAAGFVNLMIYQGGFPEWSREKQLLIARGKDPGVFNPTQKK